MFQYVCYIFFHIIYNTILNCHMFPTAWRTTIVTEIFKNKGATKYAPNYRPVSLVQLMAKIFDFILVGRFQRWFKSADEQTAYQAKKGSADHVFLLRCLIQHAKRFKDKMYIIAIDFDGAFDRISRSLLIRKLILFGAGTVFVSCIASIYMRTDSIMFRNNEHMTYRLYSGIKQGLPLSPLLFIFYVNYIFDFFGCLFDAASNTIYDKIHILMHADDATLVASTREKAVCKFRSLLTYCNRNFIIPQYSKCEFIVINGKDDDKVPLPFGNKVLNHADYITILGSHLSSEGQLKEDLQLHMLKRFPSVIKFYNFIRANRNAPLPVKIKVLKACVINSLLYNCETFGNLIPNDLEKTYIKLIKCTFGVRSNTPNLILYAESGFLPIKALAYSRQLKFYRRLLSNITVGSRRKNLLESLLEDVPISYLQHYVNLNEKYDSEKEIYKEYSEEVKTKIITNAQNGHYKYMIYLELNPTLSQCPYLNNLHPICNDITKFRLCSHRLPIETGRWNRTPREQRICTFCESIGGEKHILYQCGLVERNDFGISRNIDEIWSQKDIFELFQRITNTPYL